MAIWSFRQRAIKHINEFSPLYSCADRSPLTRDNYMKSNSSSFSLTSHLALVHRFSRSMFLQINHPTHSNHE